MAIVQPLLFGDLLRRHRLASGLTQAELAERAQLSANAISALESGARRSPRKDTVALLAQALGLSAPERARFEAAARQCLALEAPASSPVSLLHASNTSPPLVGRAAELALLERHLGGEGPPVLLLAGEPGIGKSRLLEEAEWRANEQGWRVLGGGCTRRSGQGPYAPFPRVLSRFYEGQLPAERRRRNLEGCSWLVRLLPELAESRLVPAPDGKLPPEQERRLMFAAVRRLLDNIARPAGTLLLLDDLQWAGADALDLLADLMHSLAQKPLRIVAAYRDTEVRPEDPLAIVLADLAGRGLAAHHPLGPLAPAEARALADKLLAEALAGDSVTPAARAHRADEVATYTGGVPFFLISCALAPCKPDGTDGAGAEASWEIPPWNVAASIQQRVAVLPEASQYLLGAAAVVGRTVPRTMLLAIAAQAGWSRRELLLRLAAACRGRLLAEAGKDAYTFVHDLIREVVRADLGSAQRAELHLQVAELLEQAPEGSRERHAAALADHFAQAGERARALPYALAAGDQAEAVYAHGEAERHYRAALEWAGGLGDQPREAEALERLAGVLDLVAHYEEAIAALTQAVSLWRAVGDRERFATATIRLGRACDRAGVQPIVRAEHYRRAVAFLAPEEGEEGEALAGGEADLAGPRAERALNALYALSPRAAAWFSMGLGTCLSDLNRPEEGHVAIQRAVELARDAGDQQLLGLAHMMQGTVLARVGQLGEAIDEAIAAWQAGVLCSEAAHDSEILAIILGNLGEIAVERGDLVEADPLLARALECANQVGDPHLIGVYQKTVADMAFVRGNWRQARDTLQGVKGATDFVTQLVQVSLGRLDLAEGRPEQGIAALEAVAAQSSAPQGLNVSIDATVFARQTLAECALLADRAADAHAWLQACADDEEIFHAGASIALAWALLELGEDERAERTLARVIAQVQVCGWRLLEVDALRVQGLLEWRRGRGHEAADALEESLSLCRAMPYPYAEAKALYVYGQLHAAKGESEQAREQYQAALAICERLGEGLYRRYIERALAELDLTPWSLLPRGEGELSTGAAPGKSRQ